MEPLDDDPLMQTTGGRAVTVQASKREEKCVTEVPPPTAIIIFGASGDLTSRKLLPSLYRLYKSKMLSDRFFILGTSRVEMTTDQFRATLLDAVKVAFPAGIENEVWDAF